MVLVDFIMPNANPVIITVSGLFAFLLLLVLAVLFGAFFLILFVILFAFGIVFYILSLLFGKKWSGGKWFMVTKMKRIKLK